MAEGVGGASVTSGCGPLVLIRPLPLRCHFDSGLRFTVAVGVFRRGGSQELAPVTERDIGGVPASGSLEPEEDSERGCFGESSHRTTPRFIESIVNERFTPLMGFCFMCIVSSHRCICLLQNFAYNAMTCSEFKRFSDVADADYRVKDNKNPINDGCC